MAGGGNASPFGQIMPCAGSGPARLVVTHRGRDWRLPGRCVTPSALATNVHRLGYAALGFGRPRTTPAGRKRPVPPGEWIWSPEPTHPAITDRKTWDAAQTIGAGRGNVRDPETPTTRQGRRYILRSRIRHNACQRRMCGTYRSSATGATYIYYKCPHDPANPRHAAAYPDHGTVALPEALIMAAIGTFFDQYVFSHDRAALLAAQLPATDAEHAEARERQEAHLRAELGRIDIAERALISELETPADPGDPATQAYRARIRARYAELYDQRTRTETQLKTLQAATPDDSQPDLLDALPIASRRVHRRPGPDQGSPARRVRHQRPLPARPRPGHHPGRPHGRHPPHYCRPA